MSKCSTGLREGEHIRSRILRPAVVGAIYYIFVLLEVFAH